MRRRSGVGADQGAEPPGRQVRRGTGGRSTPRRRAGRPASGGPASGSQHSGRPAGATAAGVRRGVGERRTRRRRGPDGAAHRPPPRHLLLRDRRSGAGDVPSRRPQHVIGDLRGLVRGPDATAPDPIPGAAAFTARCQQSESACCCRCGRSRMTPARSSQPATSVTAPTPAMTSGAGAQVDHVTPVQPPDLGPRTRAPAAGRGCRRPR